MIRAFLSHSSKDKEWYADIIAKSLSKDKIAYDQITFEEGMMSLDEINHWLSKSCLFVVLLSENSLNSDWVKYELNEAKRLFDTTEKLNMIYPIIIDSRINYKDSRIPEWLKDRNLKLIKSPTIASRRIKQRLREISWKHHPRLKEKESIFFGRNNLVKSIEERIYSLDNEQPFAIVASGLNRIGRKSLIDHTLKKLNVVRESYKAPTIELNTHESIEDFILKLNDLGFTSGIELTDFLSKKVDEKVELAYKMLMQIKAANEKVFINDNGCLITPEREIVDWFSRLLKKIEGIDWLGLGIAARFRPLEYKLFNYTNLFAVHVSELDVSERKGLLKLYADFEGLNLDREDLKYFAAQLKGFPEQVFYAVSIIKDYGVVLAKNKTDLIIDYNTQRITELLNVYSDNKKALDLLNLIAEFDIIHYNFLFEIIEQCDECYTLLEEFFARGICDHLGINNEYIRMNDAFKDYLRRNSYELPQKFQENIKKHVEDFLKDEDKLSRDISDFQYSVKRAIINEKYEKIRHLLIPSHFLNTMKELYDTHKKYEDVVILADRVLKSEEYIDPRIQFEIRYFLCLALARLKKNRFKQEVMKIKGPEHDFLFGFYYRQIGNYTEAIDRLQKALKSKERFARAQRELVQVYLSIEDYDTALELAKENYENDKKRNPYHVQAYFSCVVKQSKTKENIEILKKLLKDLEDIKTDKGIEMYLRCSAYYQAFIDNNEKEAIKIINEAITKFPDSLYVRIDKFYICLKFDRISEINDIFEYLEKSGYVKNKSFENTFYRMKILKLAKEGKIKEALQLIDNFKNYPENSIQKLKEKILKNDENEKKIIILQKTILPDNAM